MSTSAVFYPHAINFASGNDITHLEDLTPAYNFADLVEISAGQTAPQYANSSSSAPDLPFTTKQVKDVLDRCTTSSIAFDAAGGNVDVFYKKAKAHGTREADASAVHNRIRLTDPVMYWTGLSASQNRPATINARILPIYGGSTDPMIQTGSVALAGTSAVNTVFTLGPVQVNGATIGGVTDMSWDNQIQLDLVQDSGEPFPSYCSIAAFAPVVTFRTRDVTTFTAGSRGATLSSLAVYLRKFHSGAITVANGTAEHIKLTATAGIVKTRSISGMNGVADVAIQLIKTNATTDPFAVNTAIAIT